MSVRQTSPTDTGSVTSNDATTIGYRRVGVSSPGLVLLHGAMETSASHLHLAETLADAFTVYLPDRRGRGLSGPHRAGHDLRTEVDDLEAARTLPIVRQVAAFDPVIVVGDSLAIDWDVRLDQELERGDTAAALVTGMLGTQMGPPFLRRMPRRLLESMTRRMMHRTNGDEVSMAQLAPTLPYDVAVVRQKRDRAPDYTDLRADVMLLGGSKSPAWLKTGLAALHEVLPAARRVDLPGIGHNGSGNTRPGRAARCRRRDAAPPLRLNLD